MDSSNSEEEYDSHAYHETSSFLNHHPIAMFHDLSSNNIIALSQSQTNTTDLPTSSSPGAINQSLLGPQALSHTRKLSSSVRNPKKRSRASRRAPTTVLTTDTTNFRSMVQEFTGIPAPPFSASPLDTSKKVHPINPMLLLSSHSPSRLLHTNNSSSINYQLPPNPQNIMLSMQDHPILSFHPSLPLGNTISGHQAVNAHMVATTGTGIVSGHYEYGDNSSGSYRVMDEIEEIRLGS